MLDVIQDIVRQAAGAMLPVELVDGVILTAPPEITIRVGTSDALEIDKDQIVISRSLLPRTLSVTMIEQEYKTSENASYQPFWLQGDLDFTDTLIEGETVLMLRYAQGQKYYVIDRGVSFGTDS